MSALSDVKELLGLGAVNWKSRLQPTITFVSPEGNQFIAFWRGSPRSTTKKLGIFSFPKIRGQVVQDLDSNSDTYPLTFYFEGANNDTEAQRFFMATRENGPWEITHPVHGFLELNLVSITEETEPVESGNITKFTSEWIEAIDEDTLLTARELAGIVDALGDDLNVSAAFETAKNVVQTSLAVTAAASAAVQAVQNVVTIFLLPLFEGNETLKQDNKDINEEIELTLSADPIDITELAGELQNLIVNPILSSNDVVGRIDAYASFIAGVTDILPTINPDLVAPKSDAENKNKTAIVELALSAAILANAKIVTTGELNTRAQAIEMAEQIGNALAGITESLESIQTDYETKDLENQYFSQSSSFTDSASVTTAAVRYLLISAYDLKIEKRFILEKARRPIEITISEYGSLGENDANYDLFIESNSLKGRDIFLLPAGREVIVYV